MINAVTCYYDSSDLSNHFEIQGIKSFRFHSQFGAEGPLKFGGAYASSIEFEYYINSQRDLNTGDALVHYQKFERSQTDFHLLPEGTYRTIFNNVFYVYSFEKNKNVARVVAYDAIKFLDIDYSKRLSSIESSFPMTIYDLLQDIFSYSGCNVSLPLFNYDLKFTPVDYFYVEKITARTIVSCIAELNGNNLLASTEDNAPFTPKISFSAYSGYAGQIVGYPEYSRYGAKNYIIAPTDQDTYIVDNVQLIPAFYKENSLEVGTDEYKEIDCVKAIKLNGDVVASYGNTENNVYYVRNNVIVENVSSMTNNAISTLYNEARVIDATPAVKVNLFPFRCPFVIRGITYFVDTDGSIKKLPIMSMDWTESHVIVQSFGTSVQDYSEYSFQNVEEQNTSIVSVLNKLESDLNDKVSKSGDTMTGDLTISGASSVVKDPRITTGVTPQSNIYGRAVYLNDSQRFNIGTWQIMALTNGCEGFQLVAGKKVNNVNKFNYIRMLVDANGNPVVELSGAAAWRTALETIKYANITGTDTTSGASDYARAIKTILTSAAPQAWAKGSYAGTFQKSNSGTQTAWSGQYILNVAYSGSNYGTQGSVAVQGRIYNVWYQNGVWSVNPVNNDSGNNYCKMPDGTLIQWGTKSYSGTIAAGGTATDTVTFPTSFANSSYSLICNLLTSVPSQRTASLSTRSVSSATISLQNTYSSASDGATYSWIAIGRWK